jgi:hypothetical protein
MTRDSWQPRKLDREAVSRQLDKVRWQVQDVERNFSKDSTNLDLSYDELLQGIEALYTLMRLDLLAQDNQRRKKAHFRKVERANNG